MTTARPRHSRLRATMFAAASLAAVVTACSSALNHAGGTAPAVPVGEAAAPVAQTAPPSAPAVAPAVAPTAPTAKDTRAYFEYQVEEPVTHAPGNTGPKYPPEQRAAGIEGQVLAQFVVGTDGLAEPGSFKAIRGTTIDATGKKTSYTKGASDPDLTPFEIAVRDALPSMRFVPAKVKGVIVRQVVQEPFVFAIAKE